MLECVLTPLRHRKEDVPILIERILEEISHGLHLQAQPKIPNPVMDLLLNYDWPGNVRELRNALERLITLSKGREMQTSDLSQAIRSRSDRKAAQGPQPICTIEEIEKDLITRVLAMESNQEKAAEILGITKVTLWRKRKEYGLP